MSELREVRCSDVVKRGNNLNTITADGGFDPAEVCTFCVEVEAVRIAILDGEDFEDVLERVWDDALNVNGDLWRERA